MAFRAKRVEYGSQPSWRRWRDINGAELASAGVPAIALESERKWHFFLQEAEPTLMGGAPFDVRDLTGEQRQTLRRLIDDIIEYAKGGDLLAELDRLAEHESSLDLDAAQQRDEPDNE